VRKIACPCVLAYLPVDYCLSELGLSISSSSECYSVLNNNQLIIYHSTRIHRLFQVKQESLTRLARSTLKNIHLLTCLRSHERSDCYLRPCKRVVLMMKNGWTKMLNRTASSVVNRWFEPL
jgi:hypothetical protein